MMTEIYKTPGKSAPTISNSLFEKLRVKLEDFYCGSSTVLGTLPELPQTSNMWSYVTVVRGTLMQIWKSLYMFVFVQNQYPENFHILNPKNSRVICPWSL